MLVKRIETDKNNEQVFSRCLSFTEKSRQRLSLFRRRSLQQANDDGKSHRFRYDLHNNEDMKLNKFNDK